MMGSWSLFTDPWSVVLGPWYLVLGRWSLVLIFPILFMAADVVISVAGAMPGDARQEV